jgi:hypothetical protein
VLKRLADDALEGIGRIADPTLPAVGCVVVGSNRRPAGRDPGRTREVVPVTVLLANQVPST